MIRDKIGAPNIYLILSTCICLILYILFIYSYVYLLENINCNLIRPGYHRTSYCTIELYKIALRRS